MDEYLEHLGVRRWKGFDSGAVCACRDLARVRKLVMLAMRRQAWIAIRGEVGSGKTTAVNDALAAEAGRGPSRVIRPQALDVPRLRIGHVLEAIVRDLSAETVRQSIEARSHQARRLLGEAARAGAVCIVIEDAHYLHPQTLSALKRLREMEFAGRTRLAGLILVGAPELSARLRRCPEAGLRARAIEMKGFSRREVAGYIEWLGVAKIFEPAALDLVAQLAVRPLAIQTLIRDAAERAFYAGAKRIAVDHIAGDDLRSRAAIAGPSAVSRATGVAKSTVSEYVHGKRLTPQTEARIRDGLADLGRKKASA